ncbi:hypothetical protein CRUP_013180, partial [Coryphaenoides rupestris]
GFSLDGGALVQQDLYDAHVTIPGCTVQRSEFILEGGREGGSGVGGAGEGGGGAGELRRQRELPVAERLQSTLHGRSGEPLGGGQVPAGERSQSEPPHRGWLHPPGGGVAAGP